MYKTILVPLDGSSPARDALEVAVNLLDRKHGVLHLLNVQERPPAQDTLGHLAGAPAQDADDAVQSQGRAVIDDSRKSIELAPGQMRFVVRAGRPGKVIVSEAERLGAEAVVLGSRGTSGIGGLLLGSVSNQVLHEAPCRVIVVR